MGFFWLFVLFCFCLCFDIQKTSNCSWVWFSPSALLKTGSVQAMQMQTWLKAAFCNVEVLLPPHPHQIWVTATEWCPWNQTVLLQTSFTPSVSPAVSEASRTVLDLLKGLLWEPDLPLTLHTCSSSSSPLLPFVVASSVSVELEMTLPRVPFPGWVGSLGHRDVRTPRGRGKWGWQRLLPRTQAVDSAGFPHGVGPLPTAPQLLRLRLLGQCWGHI